MMGRQKVTSELKDGTSGLGSREWSFGVRCLETRVCHFKGGSQYYPQALRSDNSGTGLSGRDFGVRSLGMALGI